MIPSPIPARRLPAARRRLAATVPLALALLALAGCSTEPPQEPPQLLPPVGTRPLPPPTVAPSVEVRPTYRGPWEDPSNPLYQRTVFFDYDSSAIKPDYIGIMRNHAAYLAANAGTRVVLEGHTDERGSREYNLALGDQRAEAVRKFMVAEGVNPDQMTTLSYGEERPADLGHGESDWARNRRAIIQY